MPKKSAYEELEHRIRILEQMESEHRKAEVALRESEERFRLVFQTNPDSINLNKLDDGMFIDINDGFTKILGYTREDVIGKTSLDLNIWKKQEDRARLVDGLREKGYVENLEAQFVGKDGQVHHGLMSARVLVINNDHVILSITRDISERKCTEHALAEELGFQRVLGEIASAFINIPSTAIDDGINHALKTTGEFTGADRSYVIRFDFQAGTIKNTHEWSRDGIEPEIDNLQDVPIEVFGQVIDQLVNLQVVHIPLVAELTPEDGAGKEAFEAEGIRSLLLVPLVAEARCFGTVGFDFVTQERCCTEGDVRLLQMLGATLSNVLERKQVEEALRESEEKYRALIENANDAIFVAQDALIKFANAKTEEIVGYSKEDLGRIPFTDLIHSEDRAMVLDRHKKRLSGEKLPSTYSFRVVSKTNEVVWVQLNTMVIQWEGHPATLNFLRDVTQQRKFESQLQQIQKMEAIGTLAGGIAHDFNNLLMGIQGRASLLAMELGPAKPHMEHCEAIEKHVRSATALTRQLLGFTRGGKYDVKPIDINDLLLTTAAMFGRTRKAIRIHTRTHAVPLVVDVDERQIEQLLLNLFINAWQAMPDGGKIYLETAPIRLDEVACQSYRLEPGCYSKTSVTDTGIGMDKATMQRIFDPFFTTKEKSHGTGLGLASAFGIVKNHGGIITVYSEVGQGTTFNIYLPVSDQKVHPREQEKEGVIKGSGTILLVDDEEMIIDVGRAILEKLGYGVIVANGGEEAVEAVRQKRDGVDLVILDMIMPGLDGGKTFDRIRKIRPGLPVILSSGFSVNGKATEILSRGCNGFIQKPFNIFELSKKIHETLETSR